MQVLGEWRNWLYYIMTLLRNLFYWSLSSKLFPSIYQINVALLSPNMTYFPWRVGKDNNSPGSLFLPKQTEVPPPPPCIGGSFDAVISIYLSKKKIKRAKNLTAFVISLHLSLNVAGKYKIEPIHLSQSTGGNIPSTLCTL